MKNYTALENNEVGNVEPREICPRCIKWKILSWKVTNTFLFIHKSNSNINNKYVTTQEKHCSYMHRIEVVSNQWYFLRFLFPSYIYVISAFNLGLFNYNSKSKDIKVRW